MESYYISIFCFSFPNDTDLQTEGTVTVQVLAELDPTICQVLVNQKAHERLIHVLEKYSPDTEIGELAAECLLVLAKEQKEKDSILMWAVETSQPKVAEVFLQRGALTDCGVSEKSPLCSAVDTGDQNMVELLLEHRAPNAQQALKVSLERQHDHIAGVLLRHIGYDKEGSALAWSGLNLNNLLLEHIYPSLTGKSCRRSSCVVESWGDHLQRADEIRKKRWSSSSRPQTADPYQRSGLSGNRHECVRRTASDITSERLSESLQLDTDDELYANNGNITVRKQRPKSLTGAVLPFSSLDPRLEGPLDVNEKVIMVPPISPVPTSYPGHPNSRLMSDGGYGSLIPSPERDQSSMKTTKQMTRSITTSLLDISRSEYNMNDERASSEFSSPVRKRKDLCRFNSLGNIVESVKRTDTEAEISSIRYVDLSCNSLTDVNIFTSKSSRIANFTYRLQKLDLSKNKLSTFSMDLCSALPNLTQLYLRDNNITEFPYDILCHKNIEILDLSKNKITSLQRHEMQTTLSLYRLDLSKNRLSTFPSFIGDVFPGLTNLLMSSNQISDLPLCSLNLVQLRDLNLSRNNLQIIPPQFLSQCTMLQKLDLSKNRLISLPESNDVTLTRLSIVRVAHNCLAERAPFFVPRLVLRLPNLQVLDISHNKITQIPAPSQWSSRSLRDLNFDHNRIKKINFGSSPTVWSYLWRLSLSHNKVEELPSDIGHLTSLSALDISYNPIRKIPDELGRLRKLYDFPLGGLRLNLHPSLQKATGREIVSFLHSKLRNAVPYHRLKLMLVGLGGRGKTSLLRQLQMQKHPAYNVATVGVEVKDWKFKNPRKNFRRKSPKFILSTWDFAGQEDFYSTHQYFLSSRAVYLAIYNASHGPEELKSLRQWLLNIQAAAPGSPVILVGTHADKISTTDQRNFINRLQDAVEEFVRSPGFPLIQGSAIVNCTKETPAMETLREKIYDVIESFTYKDQPIVGQMVPRSYVQLEDALKEESIKQRGEGSIPVISQRELVKLTKENGIQLDKEELRHAVKFLHDTG